MPTKLTETKINFGTGPDGNDVIRNHAIFGDPSIAEKFIEWSKKQPEHTTFEKKTCWGLSLRVIAHFDEPQIHLLVNTKELGEFLAQFGPITAFCIMEYGITLVAPTTPETDAINGRFATATIFIEQPEGNIVLLEYDPQDETGNLLVGAIKLTDEGFIFHSTSEVETALKDQQAEVKPAMRLPEDMYESDFEVAIDDYVEEEVATA